MEVRCRRVEGGNKLENGREEKRTVMRVAVQRDGKAKELWNINEMTTH